MRELLLIDIEGLTYGIWADEVRAIENLQDIHHIPLSPACIAGMSIIHDRTVALADLSVCLGHGPMQRSGKGNVLFMSDREKVTGFAVEGPIARVPVQPESVHPMPDYLKTLVIDSSMREGERLYPLVNISVLYNRVQTIDREPARASLSVVSLSAGPPGPDRVRMVRIGAEQFAIPGQGTIDAEAVPALLTRLKDVPRYVSGILFHRGRVLPIIDLMQRIYQRRSGPDDLLMVADINGSLFGLIVQEDRGLVADVPLIKPLPVIARSPWLVNAVLHAGGIVPLIDLAALIAAPAEEPRIGGTAHQFAPDSSFPSQFGREKVAVTEISILGVRHALPKSEVEDVLGFKPYRTVPNTLPIVAGVAEHGDGLLPVIDLAMVFGRRSRTTPESRMVLVKNGDFRALVITETAINEKRLDLEIQRLVPIALPHHLLYGCYPEADAVHLILNVQALTVHFEKTMVTELMPAFGIKEGADRPATEEPAMSGSSVQLFAGAGVPDREVGIEKSEMPAEPVPVALFSELEGERAAAILTEETDAMPAQQSSERNSDQGAPAQEHHQAPTQAGLTEEAIPIEEQNPSSEEIKTSTSPVTVEENDGADAEQPRDTTMQPVTTVTTESEPIVARSLAAEETERLVPELFPPGVDGNEVQRDDRVCAPASASELHRQSTGQQGSVVVTGTAVPLVLVGKDTRKRWFISAALGLLLVAILYGTGFFDRKGTGNAEHENIKKITAKEKVSQDLRVPPGSLILDVPADHPTVANIYIVEKDDTLWHIAKRFTGNATNYPRIAGENRIAEPDLIFPGQKIYLNKQQGR